MAHLTGRRALVTGGTRGIGAAIVRRLATDGAAVAFTYVSSDDRARELADQIRAGGGTAVALRADAADAGQVGDAVAQAVSALGGLDILVNNAGAGAFGAVESLSLDEFDRLLAVNVRGVFATTQAALAHLGEGSRIINVGSVFADRAAIPGFAAYVMTKGAVAGLTRGLTGELSARGITINTVQPGPTATDMNPDRGELADTMRRFIPQGRYGDPAEAAAVVSFLAGPEANFVTGATWTVDGGYAA
jgi:3-oxoacyl-[acyl-carrier protein] reductase